MRKRIGIMVNIAKAPALKLCEELVAWLKKKEISFLIDEETVRKLPPACRQYAAKSLAELCRLDVLVTLGGDGFLLHSARALYPCRCAILPVNLGSLGFNAQVSTSEVLPAIEQALAGKLKVQQRLMLSTAILRAGNKVFSGYALNEVLLTKTAVSRIIKIEMRVEGQFAAVYHSDGVLISTPTGSTAYNLALGGPIVHPETRSFIVTGLAPHSLSQRPLILPASYKIELSYRQVKEREAAMLVVDGQQFFELCANDVVQVWGARQPLKVYTLSTGYYFKSLQEKLHWGGN